MARGLVLDPTGEVGVIAHSRSMPQSVRRELVGLRVGIRHDEHWRSWDWITADWAERLEAEGAEVTTWRAGRRVGDDSDLAMKDQIKFYDSIDTAIVGLCNCGGCTMQTVRDAADALDRGIPAAVVATESFTQLAHQLAADFGWPDMPVISLPFPLEGQPKSSVLEVAQRSYADMIGALR